MRDAPQLFPVFFVLMWLAVTSTLGLVSGWYALSGFYPNRDEPPLLSLRMQSGSMRWVGMRSILNLDVCPSGLRVGMMRLFGVFCRDFFVPWDQISVVRNDRLFWREAKLVFGQPANGSLKLQAEVANRLARAAGARWPEVGPFPAETNQAALQRLGKEWIATTLLAAAFVILAPRLLAPKTEGPPVAVAVGFPAVVFGIAALLRFVFRRRD
jgi:hypothetical protein